MVPYARELQLSRLPAGARQRLIQCIGGHAAPHPVWTQPVAPDERWKFLLGGGFVLLVVMALIHGHEPLDLLWMAGWALGCVPIGLGFAIWWRQRRIASRLPFPVGKYLFATELIDASDGVCRIYDLDRLTGLRVAGVFGKGGAAEAELQLVFGREVQGLHAPAKPAAERVMHNLEAARNTLAESMAAQFWDGVGALDPLYEARYGGTWEKMSTPATVRWSTSSAPSPGKFSFHRAVLGWGLAAALLLAPVLWWGDNFRRDEMAFNRARSSRTVRGFKTYLQRGESRHSAVVRQELLPEAASRAAHAAGSVQALREFIAKYPDSSFVAQARAKLHAEYAKAIDHAKSEADTSAGPALTALLRWLEENGTSVVQVRFGGSSEANLSRFDDIIRLIQRELKLRRGGIEFPPIAPSFSREAVQRREDVLIRSVRQGFEKIVPADLLEFERGGGFAGQPVGFPQPALTVQWLADLPETKEYEPIETDDGKIYLQLAFQFEVNLVVPGAPPFNFQCSLIPGEFLAEMPSGKSAYEGMSDLAFDELHQSVATKFFPRFTPARTVERSKVARLRTKAEAPAPDQMVSSATGFCISPSGYIVTAQHFTRSAGEFKVVTKSGLVPADLVLQDDKNDMAVLKIRGGFPSALGIRPSRSVKLGEAVATIGFPNTALQGQEPKVTDGKISSLAGMRDDPRMFQMSVPVQPGNSGGPLLDVQGNVIGVVVAQLNLPAAQNVNYAVKSSLLLSFLDSVPQLSDAPPPREGEPPKFEDMVERVKQATVLIKGFGTPVR